MTVDNVSPKPLTISLLKAKQSFGLTGPELTALLKEQEIPKYKNSQGKPAITMEDYNRVKGVLKEESAKTVLAEKTTRRNRHKNQNLIQERLDEIAENVIVNVRDRSHYPEKAIIFAGPTNSGKTYNGLEELFHDFEANPEQVHVYCGPLRLLAFEVYNKMVERYGEEKVGFITGEEAINPDAKLLATTCEMAPDEGASILIDEAHWLADPERGHIWSRLLISARFTNLYIISAAEAIEVIQKLTEDAWYSEVRTFERKTPIVFKGFLELKALPPKTAVVCFSRKSVYAVARQLERIGKKVGVLYGGLPLNARKRQIQAYLDGKYDIMVTTDVIGHGINLPIDNVVFAQTQKFDGQEVRDLYLWETAQIAGRAGRFGLSKEGSVYLGKGLPWFSNDKDLIRVGTEAAAGKRRTDLDIEEALLAPRLSDLGLNIEGSTAEAAKILPALAVWKDKANKSLKDRILSPSDLTTLSENVATILRSIGGQLAPWSEQEIRLYTEEELSAGKSIDLLELWQLASGPYDSALGTISKVATWLTSPLRDADGLLKRFHSDRVAKRLKAVLALSPKEASAQIEMLEESIRVNAELKMAMIMFGVPDEEGERHLGTLKESELHSADEGINNVIIQILSLGIKNSSIGSCLKCGKPTKPWHKECDICHEEGKILRYRSHNDEKKY